MTRPVRMQVSRRKGFDLHAKSKALNGLPAKRISRPGAWGNPFSIDAVAAESGLDSAAAQAEAVARFGRWVHGELDPRLSPGPAPSRESIRTNLQGQNLACWCAPGTPCHADVLIALAND